MATIALRNSPSWNCHLQLKPHPMQKQEKLRQPLGKSHAPRERRRRKPARWRDKLPYQAGQCNELNPLLGRFSEFIKSDRIVAQQRSTRRLQLASRPFILRESWLLPAASARRCLPPRDRFFASMPADSCLVFVSIFFDR